MVICLERGANDLHMVLQWLVYRARCVVLQRLQWLLCRGQVRGAPATCSGRCVVPGVRSVCRARCAVLRPLQWSVCRARCAVLRVSC